MISPSSIRSETRGARFKHGSILDGNILCYRVSAIKGADAGLHILVWFRDLPARVEMELVEGALALGVGVYAVSSLYDLTLPACRPDRVGLVMGYAALDTRRIERGIYLLNQAVNLIRV
ncbi:hypothetical protein D3227_06715 [Mesorhizobium waimense]|uniref:PLP-dependent aminotransferase family protein n=1 Tax=Mesorhizobium waimense TaxID=1300307 RepID=A0A3A5KXI0_9HYPH|nr:hypothetical protein D3227_06715 [Mesorhizobium waimense]